MAGPGGAARRVVARLRGVWELVTSRVLGGSGGRGRGEVLEKVVGGDERAEGALQDRRTFLISLSCRCLLGGPRHFWCGMVPFP
jgi:hypothetical protein